MTDSNLTRRKILRRTGATIGAVTIGVSATSGTATATRACPRSPGFWANHDWCSYRPIAESLALGIDCDGPGEPTFTFHGVTQSVEDWQHFLIGPVRGDKATILAKQLLATVLNFNRRPSADPDCVDQPIDLSAFGLGTTSIRCVKRAAERWLARSSFPDPHRDWDSPTVELAQHCTAQNKSGTGVIEVGGEGLKDALDAFNNDRLGCSCSSTDRDDDDRDDDKDDRGRDDDEDKDDDRGRDDDDDDWDDDDDDDRGRDDDDDDDDDDRDDDDDEDEDRDRGWGDDDDDRRDRGKRRRSRRRNHRPGRHARRSHWKFDE